MMERTVLLEVSSMILDEEAIAGLLRMDEVIEVIARALHSFSAGRVVQPVRTVVPVAEHGGFFGVMPAYAHGALGVKLVSVYPNNADPPTHQATIVLFDPRTGAPLVTMDGRLITEVRTAAASAVATRLLARNGASVLALLGTGVQARSHLAALRLNGALREIRVWSPRNAAAFAREYEVAAASSAEEAARGADIIVTATSATEPVLRGSWLSPGAHINAVGACRPHWRELDDEALRRARIFVDSREAAFVESGDVIAAGQIVGEIGEVIAGSMPERQSTAHVLTTANDRILNAPHDVEIPPIVHRGQLAGVHPATRIDRPGGGLGVVPVAQHDDVGAYSELTRRIARHNLARVGIDDFDLDVGMHSSNRANALLDFIVRFGLCTNGARLRRPPRAALGRCHAAFDGRS